MKPSVRSEIRFSEDELLERIIQGYNKALQEIDSFPFFSKQFGFRFFAILFVESHFRSVLQSLKRGITREQMIDSSKNLETNELLMRIKDTEENLSTWMQLLERSQLLLPVLTLLVVVYGITFGEKPHQILLSSNVILTGIAILLFLISVSMNPLRILLYSPSYLYLAPVENSLFLMVKARRPKPLPLDFVNGVVVGLIFLILGAAIAIYQSEHGIDPFNVWIPLALNFILSTCLIGFSANGLRRQLREEARIL